MKVILIFLLGILCMAISASLLTGYMQKYIYFADPLSELFCCVLIAMLGIFTMMYSVMSDTVKK
jgi:hypothetical protein